MTRNHRKPGVIRVICTDAYHRDSTEWGEQEHHHVATLQLAERAEASDGPRVTLHWNGTGPEAPVKTRRRDDGQWVFRFRCRCGRDVQRAESRLVEIVQRFSGAFPGRRAEIDLVRLR